MSDERDRNRVTKSDTGPREVFEEPARAKLQIVRNGKLIGGCPTKYTPTTVRRLLKAISDGLTITQACKVAGIGYTTLYGWYSSHPELEPKLEAARENARQKALSTIKKASLDDWRAAESYLKLSFFLDYSKAATTNVSVNAQAGVAVEISDPERARLVAMREKALANTTTVEVLPFGERAIDPEPERLRERSPTTVVQRADLLEERKAQWREVGKDEVEEVLGD